MYCVEPSTPGQHHLLIALFVGAGVTLGCSQIESHAPDESGGEVTPTQVAAVVHLVPTIRVDGEAITDLGTIFDASQLVVDGHDGELVAVAIDNGFSVAPPFDVGIRWARDHGEITFASPSRSLVLRPTGTAAQRKSSVATLVALGLAGQLASLEDTIVGAAVDECQDDLDCAFDEFCHTMFANDCRPKKELLQVCSRHGKCLSGCCKFHWWVQKTCRPAEDCN